MSDTKRSYSGDNTKRSYSGDNTKRSQSDNTKRSQSDNTKRSYSGDNTKRSQHAVPEMDTSSLYETPRTYRSNRVPPIPIRQHLNLKLEDDDGTIDPVDISPIATNRSLLPDVPRTQNKVIQRKTSPPHTPARRSRPESAVSTNNGALVAFNCEYIRADERGVEMVIAPRDKTEITYNNGKFAFSIKSI